MDGVSKLVKEGAGIIVLQKTRLVVKWLGEIHDQSRGWILPFSGRCDKALARQNEDDKCVRGTYWSEIIMPCMIVLIVTGEKIEVQVSEEFSAVDSILPNTEDFHIRMPCHHMVWSEFRELFWSYLAKLKAEESRESRHHTY